MKNLLQKLGISQRILLIFIFCVLIPLTLTLGMSFSRLENELKDQSFQRLRFEAKNISMSIMERLIQLEAEMRFLIDRNLGTLGNEGELKSSWFKKTHFENLTYVGPNGPVQLFEDKHTLPIELPTALLPLSPKKPLLIQRNITGKLPQVIIAIALSGSECLLGQINMVYLLNEESNFNLPPNTELSILGPDETVIASTIQEPLNLIHELTRDERVDHKSAFIWKSGNKTYLASAQRLFVESAFSGKSWTVVLSRPEEAILGPIDTLQTSIYLTGLLIVLGVILMSSISIRKSLNPLKKLVACANSIGKGNFSIKADLGGSLEFKKLSLAVNSMAEQIERQLADLRESEKRFKASFEEASAGMALVDEDGRPAKVNKALSEILGYTQSELMSNSLYDCIHKNKINDDANQAESVLDLKVVNKAVETRFLHREGKVVSGLVNTSPIGEYNNSGSFYIVHIQDITTQKAAQIENQKLEAQLYHAQKMEAVGTLAAGIAHDFNNILSAIMGNAELAMMDAAADTVIHKDLENVLQACQRASDLTKQILSFSRSDKDEMAPIQLNVAVKEALKLLRSSIPSHISIVQDISAKPFVVKGDLTQIHQLIMNLCTNSYHAMMKKDTGTLKVSLTPDVIELPKYAGTKSCLKLQVSDTGSGMTPEVMKKIFEPYFTTKDKGHGTGLGLSIAHSIVEKHGGTINVESEVGIGTTFTINFPIVEQRVENEVDLPQLVESGNESILIVDDEKDIARIWQQTLQRQGYDVVSKGHPFEALAEFKKSPERYSLVITDLAMPDMTGDKLCQEIFKVNPQVPIILCTGYFEEMRLKTICSSVKQNLIKPVKLGTLAETVRKVIDNTNAAHLACTVN
jgi:PAS domain S-box-containing protein